MGLTIWQVDAFADAPLTGNPAAVCILPEPRDAAWMQAIGREMNLSYYMGPHAGLRQTEHEIATEEIEVAFGNDSPEIIEDYPNDPRGHCCLIRGECPGVVLHIVCTRPNEEVFIVTCYRPEPALWYPSFRKRRPRRR